MTKKSPDRSQRFRSRSERSAESAMAAALAAPTYPPAASFPVGLRLASPEAKAHSPCRAIIVRNNRFAEHGNAPTGPLVFDGVCVEKHSLWRFECQTTNTRR